MRLVPVFLLALVVSAAGRTAKAEGFDLFAQGSKAMGMAGAFVAQADDPSAMFYNPGGLAMVEGKKASIGMTTYVLNESLYQGLPPGIGAGTSSAQNDAMAFHPHAYMLFPVGSRAKLGLGLTSPFFIDNSWADADGFAGRAVSTSAKLSTYDLMATFGFRLGKNLGVGLGGILRLSEIEQSRRLQAVNPITAEIQDIAFVDLKTDSADATGWTAGVLHKPSRRFSWGFAYRSAIEMDYVGAAALTQISTGNDQLDALFSASIPFGEDLAIVTKMDFPTVTTFGVAIGLTKSLKVELDAEETGWSSVQELPSTFTTEPVLSTAVPLNFEDTMTTRVGLLLSRPSGAQFRLGFALEESPQPDSTVGALLAGSDRTLLAVGFGMDILDVAFVFINNDQRIISTQIDGLNGNYRSNAWMISLTISIPAPPSEE